VADDTGHVYILGVVKTNDRQCGLLDGESVAVADDTGHVYILGVVEPLPDDNRLFLDEY